MPFIGIIAKESDSNFIKNEVLKNSKKRKFEFINLNRDNIENLKNIRFETIIINDENAIILKSSKYFEEIVKNTKYLIVNSDVIKKDLIKLKNDKCIITYGLNQNAMVTISSIKNENIFICIQKEIKDINNNSVVQQEVNIEIEKSSMNKICNTMAIFAFLVIYGEFLKKI